MPVHNELRRIFGRKSQEIRGGWRKMPNQDLRNLYSLPYIIRVIKSKGWVVRDMKDAYMVIVVETELKRELGKPRHRWWNNNKT
jgi:hypothetical protein